MTVTLNLSDEEARALHRVVDAEIQSLGHRDAHDEERERLESIREKL